MAALQLGDTLSKFVVIFADTEGVPVSFPIGNDGLALVTSLRLSLRFRLSEEFMYIDEEVFDAHSAELIHTIGHSPVSEGDSKHWLLKPERFRVYGVSESVMATSIELVTPHRSSIGTVHLNLATWVKVEKEDEVINILSDDSDGNSPSVAPHIISRVDNSNIPNSLERTPTLISQPQPHSGHHQSLSVVDFLRRPWVSKGARNAFKSLDYDTLDIHRVEFLPPTFDGDIIFELPPMDTSALHTGSKSMQGMDKHHDGHAWTKTVTSHIKNDMKLTFRTSTCAGHLRCGNQDCEYTTCIHRTSPVNELEWDGFTSMPFVVGEPAPNGSTLVCKIYKVPHVCIATCGARIYYVFGPASMTRACLHLGHHDHPCGNTDLVFFCSRPQNSTKTGSLKFGNK
jgi:hypothetical protein